ncbi:hypothetical protein JAAARDRAFT_208764 [Jaapia argillacea MUCL 33604]|uniref:Uncharacterized protein n=1 Tax=Jaapia argillacea MUCL 33604 TaxID=933084 RepID=A0A067PL29_9AGAM|nr:hypothetical protein JAAARDRAFT_208764 [Jaapia argillacea MUCL 33604]
MGLYFLQSKSGNIGGFDDGDFQAFEEGPRNDLGMPRGDDRRPGSTDSQDSALSAQNDVSPFAPETASATPHGMNHQTQPIGMSEFQKHTARTREVSRAHTQLELQCHPEPLMDSRMMNYAQRDVHHPSGAINLQRAQSQDGARSLGMRPYTLPVKQPQPRYSMPAPILGSGHLHETVPYHANRFPFPSHPRPEQVPSSSTPLGHPPHHGVTMSYPSYPAPPYPPPAPLPQFQHPHAASPADHPADVAPAVAAAPTITASRGVKRRREEPDADPFETFVNFTGEIVRLHNEQTHPSSISCLVTGCQTQFTPKASKGEWTNHLVNMHGYSATDPVCCHVCKKPKAMKLESLGRHYTTKHLSLAKSQCPICLTSGYSRVDSMKRHIRQERCDEQQRHAGRVEKLRRLQGQVGALSFEDIRDLYPLP